MTRAKATVERRQPRRSRDRDAQRAQLREATEAEQQQEAQGEEGEGEAPAAASLTHEDEAEREEPIRAEKEERKKALPLQEAHEQEEEEEEDEEGEEDDNGDEGQLLLTDYEKQREHRLKENAAKLAALNLPALARSFGPPIRQQRQSSKKKSKNDDDYMPSSSSESEDSDSDDNNEDGSGPCDQQDVDGDYNEEQALQEAIALSLSATAENGAGTRSKASQTRKGKRQVSNKNDAAKKRRKGRQEQVTHDEVAAIFRVIDERGNGKFSAAELERIALSHDFTWTKQEISDMIDLFDTNKDGQLDLSEFQGIFERMNMLKMHVV